MRTFIFSLTLLAAHEGQAASRAILLAPESLNEGCATSWQVTETEGRTLLTFQDLHLDAPMEAAAQVKHCRIAWKPLIPAGCYAPSARLEIRGYLRVDSSLPMKAQLRLSHDLLGQGESSSFKSVELEEGSFQVSMELPAERFQERWDEVKLITHLSLFLRRIKQEPVSNNPQHLRAPGRLSIHTLALEPIRSRECTPVEPRR